MRVGIVGCGTSGPAAATALARLGLLATVLARGAGLSTGLLGAWDLDRVQPYLDAADLPRLPSP